MSKVFALFVGIDRYQPPVPPLNGCVADVAAMEQLLTSRVAPGSLSLQTLRDGGATRAAIIDGFRTHLRQAGADDIALFYYCGHGSQEPCPPEWLRAEPSGKNQTIIPVDARRGDVFDIADKELSALIHEVSADGAQVVVITDSCHSGGNTRAVDDHVDQAAGVARMAPPAKMRARTLDDYLDATRTLFDPSRIAESGLPEPRHIAIAACQSDQLAKEVPWQQSKRGAFSSAFEEAVRSLGPTATYLDLMNAVRVKVRSRVQDQLPNLYVSGGSSGNDLLLGGHSAQRSLTIDADQEGRWWISSGAIDGIPAPAEGVTEVAVFERGAFADGAPPPTPMATAIVVHVLEDRAQIRVGGGPLDTSRQYAGAISKLGTPTLRIVLEAAQGSAAAGRVKAHLAGSSGRYTVVDRHGEGSASSSVSIAIADDAAEARGEDGAPLAGQRFAIDEAGLAGLSRCCEHLARWYGLRDRSPAGSKLNGLVKVELVPVAATEKTAPADRTACSPLNGSVVLAYDGGKGPRVHVRLRNDARAPLYVALIDLTDSFKCVKLFGDWIPGGGTAYVAGGRAMTMKVADWRDVSVRSTTDYFQVVASIVEFDPERWNLPALLKPAATRDVDTTEDGDDTPPAEEALWGTTLLKVVTTR